MRRDGEGGIRPFGWVVRRMRRGRRAPHADRARWGHDRPVRFSPRRRSIQLQTTTPVALSRRTALAGLGAGGLGLVLTTRALGAAAQEATPPAGIVATEPAPGVTAEVFAGVPSDRAP